MKFQHFIMMVVMVLASFRPCSATDIFFQTIDTKDGLADNFVRDITRDTYGYIWIATINGLSRYDGYRLTNYMPILFGGSANDVSMVRETADTTLNQHIRGGRHGGTFCQAVRPLFQTDV